MLPALRHLCQNVQRLLHFLLFSLNFLFRVHPGPSYLQKRQDPFFVSEVNDRRKRYGEEDSNNAEYIAEDNDRDQDQKAGDSE